LSIPRVLCDEGSYELVKEEWDAVPELPVRRMSSEPLPDLSTTSLDEFGAVV
jgi:hypothetical protein